MNIRRVLEHLFMPPWRVRLAFPARTLRTIETAIREAEATHAGEIRFAVESALPLFPLLRGQPARERALQVFEQGDLRGLIARALTAARDRSRELADQLGQ